MRNDKQIARLLNNFKNDGYDKASLSEILYHVRGAVYVKDILLQIEKLGYRTTKHDGKTYVLLAEKPAKIDCCDLPAVPSLLGD